MAPCSTILMFFEAKGKLLSYLPVNILKTSIMSPLIRLYQTAVRARVRGTA